MASDRAVSHVLGWFERAERSIKPAKPFVAGPQTLTYGALIDRTRRLTTLFRELELEPDDRAVIATDDDIAAISIFMALLRNGITAVLLDPQASQPELATLIQAADAKALFMDGAIIARGGVEASKRADAALVQICAGSAAQASLLARVTRGLRAERPAPGELAYPAILDSLAPARDLPTDVAEAALAYILFTSGTTSRPKGVEITHRNLAAQMQTFVRQYGLDETTRLLNALPLHHTDGLTQGVTLTFAAAGTLFRRQRFRVDRLPQLLDTIYTDRVTHFVTVPSVIALTANLADDYDECFATEDFRFVVSTAAFLDENLWRRFEARFRTQIVNVYGLTETVCEGLYCGPDLGTRRVGTIGKPVDCEARIVDEAGRDVAPGTTGELILRGDNVMRGYFRMPDETAAVLKDGWFHTGDLAATDEDGFYRIVGRKKSVIITAGMNVYPEDVTTVLRSIPGVLDAVTFGMPDDAWGERVVSCVMPVPGQVLSVAGIAAQFLERASRAKLPLEIHIVDDLPRGPAGKVILAEVKAMVRQSRPARSGTSVGANIAERVLGVGAGIFKTEIRSLSLESDATNTAGWNSLAHVEFLLALEAEFEVRLAPRDLMTIVCLGDAVRVVEAKLAEAPPKVGAA
ncbi:MAG TPA: AMP-binding protein [Geminicoccaceae bacterium]|nr:AMP-binding protein [Geminicoccaceae bacterium]